MSRQRGGARLPNPGPGLPRRPTHEVRRPAASGAAWGRWSRGIFWARSRAEAHGSLHNTPMRFIALSIGSLLACSATAQITSGPQADVAIPKAEVYAPSGPRAGETFDVATAVGDAPCALLFVHEISRNTAPMIRRLDRLGTEYALLGLRSYAIHLADDRTAAEKQLERSSNALQMRNPMVISTAGADGPGGFALNRKCTLTLVLAKDGKIVRSIGYTDTGAQDLPALETELSRLTGPLPKDAPGLSELLAKRYPNSDAELIALTADLLAKSRRAIDETPRMTVGLGGRSPAGRDANAEAPTTPVQQEGKAPNDPELRTLLRAAINKAASPEDVGEVFAKIDARVGADPDLRAQAVEMFKLILSLNYGTEAAQTRAKKYVADHQRGGR